jgi:hypothetical protein
MSISTSNMFDQNLEFQYIIVYLLNMSGNMINKVKELRIISIYLYICDIYDSKLKNVCKCLSYNNRPDFTDQEVITIYLCEMNVEH